MSLAVQIAIHDPRSRFLRDRRDLPARFPRPDRLSRPERSARPTKAMSCSTPGFGSQRTEWGSSSWTSAAHRTSVGDEWLQVYETRRLVSGPDAFRIGPPPVRRAQRADQCSAVRPSLVPVTDPRPPPCSAPRAAPALRSLRSFVGPAEDGRGRPRVRRSAAGRARRARHPLRALAAPDPVPVAPARAARPPRRPAVRCPPLRRRLRSRRRAPPRAATRPRVRGGSGPPARARVLWSVDGYLRADEAFGAELMQLRRATRRGRDAGGVAETAGRPRPSSSPWAASRRHPRPRGPDPARLEHTRRQRRWRKPSAMAGGGARSWLRLRPRRLLPVLPAADPG